MTTPSYAFQSDPGSPTATQITDTRLLTVVRALWIVLALFIIVFSLQLFLLDLTPRGYSPRVVSEMETLGIGQAYYTLGAVKGLIGSAVSLLLSTVLMWRTRNERAALFFAFVFLLAIPAHFGIQANTIDPLLSRARVLAINFQLFAIFFLFPDGRFKPRWMGFIFVGVMLWTAVSLINSEFLNDSSAPGQFIGWFFGLGSVIYRYRHADTVQRQQLKWLVAALLMTVFAFVLWPLLVFPITDSRAQALMIAGLNTILDLPVALAIPVVVGIAMLRYRLYEVDLLLNRSLVYLGVTLLLAFIFLAIVGIVSVVTSGQGQLIGVIAASGVAGVLFNPTRKEVQRVIDHRVFRLRYDLNEVAAAQKKPDVKNPGLYTGRTFGKYEILGVLGKGGMGEVYKGFGDGQTVAVKVLPEDLARKEEFRKRFEREAQTLASLQHPNIVKLFDSGVTDDGVHYLAMEFVDGEELSDAIEQGALSDYDALRDWLKTIASALDYIHEKGLVHRDLKPSNIMLRPSTRDREISEAVLMDFGIARVDASGTRITGSGAVGTIDYMSPEQITAAREVDKRSDIYALGVIVYELVTGERPFSGSAGHVLFAHLQQPAPDPRVVNPTVPRPIANAVLRALSKSPDDRFESAGEFAAALG